MQRVVVVVRLAGGIVGADDGLGRLGGFGGRRALDASVVVIAVSRDRESVRLDGVSIMLIPGVIKVVYE